MPDAHRCVRTAAAGWGLVDDAKDLQTCDDPGVLGGLVLGVIEVRGDGDDGVITHQNGKHSTFQRAHNLLP